MDLFFDLETIPTRRLDVLDHISSNIKPPGTIKLPESIAEWHKTKGPAAAEDAVRETSLNGTFGNICVIGWAFNDEEPQYLASANDEASILSAFHEVLKIAVLKKDEYPLRVVGHNVSAFDLRFFNQRSMVRSIKPHAVMSRAAQAKPWESEKVFDTMIQWSGVGNRVSLDTLCRALDIESPKGELDGSKVWEWVQAGRIEEVGEYCCKDVAATRAVFKRMVYQP